MRATLILLISLACIGCQSDGAQPAPAMALHQTSTLEGSGVVGSVMAGPLPLTYPLKWSGNGRLTLQTSAPYVVVDGDLVVEPLYTTETQQAIADGRMLIRTPSGLSPAGTLEGTK